MIKHAVCIRTAEAHADFSNVPELKLHLVDRALCEEDPSFLQIIPYITVVSMYNGEILQYSRGQAGGEGRLIGKTSIGFGGHMDEVHNGSFYNVVATQTLCELGEEWGL